MTEDMRELIYNYEDSDHFDIVEIMNEIYNDEDDPFNELCQIIKLDMMIAQCDDERVDGEKATD